MTDYWNVEIRRLFWVGGAGGLLALLSGYWLVGLLVLLGYLVWMLSKLYELQHWLINGQNADEMPDSDGAWEQIAYLVHKASKKSAERKKSQQDLLRRFDSILSALPDAAVLLDSDNNIKWANKSSDSLLRVNGATDLGQRIDNLVRHPELHKILSEHSDKEIRFSAPRDEKITLAARLLPLPSGQRLLNVRDVSLGVQLQKTRKAFIANASHELRTPLTVLMGYLEMFGHDPELPGHLRGAVQQSYQQAERMHHIIQDMLALSRLENQEISPQAGKLIHVAQLVEQTAQNLRDTLAQSSHTLETQVDPNLCITAIEKDVASVITNLMTNAVRHTPVGTQIRVEWLRKRSGHACFAVTDNGPGIPAQHIPHLTERFYRVDDGRSRESGGTGLGLAIVKHVMELHGGYLTVKSKPGQTCFQACFPPVRVNDLP